MPPNFTITEVRLSPDGAYTVVARSTEGEVNAVFEVKVFRRHERHSHKENLEHHKKSFEQLEREAKESVLQFSQRLAETLKPHQAQ
jgi:restriction endonuclease